MGIYLNKSASSAKWIITTLSLVCAIAVLAISSALLREISTGHGESTSAPSSEWPQLGNQVFVIIISVGILAIVFQVIAAIAFWLTKYQESKSFVYGFAIGQAIIQTTLLICLGLIIYRFFKPGSKSISQAPSNSTGHGFWVILSTNIIFHIGAILYLMHQVMKRSDEEEMEEMTAVVIHRRVPSRIPSARSKRHAGFQN